MSELRGGCARLLWVVVASKRVIFRPGALDNRDSGVGCNPPRSLRKSEGVILNTQSELRILKFFLEQQLWSIFLQAAFQP